jgi:hypothetical protein
VGGHQHEFAVDEPDPDSREGAEKRDRRRNRQGRTGADDTEHIGIVLAVAGEDVRHDLHFVDVSLRKEGAHRPVGEARRKNFLESRPSLALQKPAGEFTGGGGSFAIIDGEGEEILPRPRRPVLSGSEDDGLAVLHDDRPACLFCPLSRCKT